MVFSLCSFLPAFLRHLKDCGYNVKDLFHVIPTDYPEDANYSFFALGKGKKELYVTLYEDLEYLSIKSEYELRIFENLDKFVEYFEIFFSENGVSRTTPSFLTDSYG